MSEYFFYTAATASVVTVCVAVGARIGFGLADRVTGLNSRRRSRKAKRAIAEATRNVSRCVEEYYLYIASLGGASKQSAMLAMEIISSINKNQAELLAALGMVSDSEIAGELEQAMAERSIVLESLQSMEPGLILPPPSRPTGAHRLDG